MLTKDAVKDFLLECEIKKYTWKTVKGYRNNLNFLCNYLEREHGITEIEAVSVPHIKAFQRFQQVKGRKPSYLNGLIKTFRSFFKYCIAEEYIKSNPMLKISWAREERPLIKTFTNEEVKQMISKSKGADFLSIRNQTLLAMLFDTGIRCYELCCLPLSSIKDSHIVIWGERATKKE